ncbi:substrate-binding periplasmic protein [Shewanella zhangzhouensis]|uniref:substrate-binding periplasmic protein n=1 Tax=Shewanella zhangzhouensis TaxID=2864213 RepID=UPI001C65808A|nr:ABC transporter substrate-binding protein [Shewanella zhangzhouensis]QYK04901.1 ABC transporter substrate-binding protein [Shewanella zhangzhouensis]
MRLPLILWLLLVMVGAHASTISIGASSNCPPYILEDAESGLEVEIIRAAFAAVGMEASFKFYSRKRQLLFYEKERFDGIMTVNSSLDLTGYPSDIYIYYQNVAISLAEKHLRLERVADLQNLSIAAFDDASILLGGEFYKVSKKTIYRELDTTENQNKMLYLGRIDVAVAEKYVFLANNVRLASELDTSKALDIHELFPRTAYRLMFRNSIVRDAFNEGLSKIRENGRYDALVKQFLD